MKLDAAPHVMSFLAVRRALGLLGLFLPVSLYVYARIFGNGMQPSISEFYHTGMGDVLVGVLIAIGLFLLSYKGYPRKAGERLSDHIVATIAGIGVIGVALLPAEPPFVADCSDPGEKLQVGIFVRGITAHWCSFEWLHFVCAMVFFFCMVIFCFVLFPRGGGSKDGRTNWRSAENILYFCCGTVLVFSVIALLIYAVVGSDMKTTLREHNYVFWWLCCKLGEGAMRDQGASCSPYDSALARRSCSHAMASIRAHGPRPKARSTIRASSTMPPWRANIPAWPLRSARITSKPLIVA